jgi:hypothetical protein
MNDNKNKITLNDFTRMIKANNNFSFTKFGDGEISCMRSWFGKNCDGDKYHRQLSKALKDAFVDLSSRKNMYIGQWHNSEIVEYLKKIAIKQGINDINWVNYHFVMNASPVKGITDFNSFSNNKMLEFVKAINATVRKKILFTNSDNQKLQQLFKTDVFIETKKNNWSYEFNQYYKKVESECVENTILIIAAGLCSKVLMSKLLQKFNITCIDIGSGFDLLATGKHSRPWAHSYQDELSYYKEILPKNW